jgi:hypothetical protein
MKFFDFVPIRYYKHYFSHHTEVYLLQIFFLSAQSCNSYSGYPAYDRGHNLLKNYSNNKDNILPSLLKT